MVLQGLPVLVIPQNQPDQLALLVLYHLAVQLVQQVLRVLVLLVSQRVQEVLKVLEDQTLLCFH